MSLRWCRPREATVDEVGEDADARARCSGSYSAWMRKAKSDQARAKWLCGSTKRYFTIDFDSQIFFYSHAEGAKRISHPIRFKEITGAEQMPAAASRQGCGFVLKTKERTFELHTASNTDAVQWISALNAAKEMGSVTDSGFKSGKESPAETVNSSDSTQATSPHTPTAEDDTPLFGAQDDRGGGGGFYAQQREAQTAPAAGGFYAQQAAGSGGGGGFYAQQQQQQNAGGGGFYAQQSQAGGGGGGFYAQQDAPSAGGFYAQQQQQAPAAGGFYAQGGGGGGFYDQQGGRGGGRGGGGGWGGRDTDRPATAKGWSKGQH